MKKVLIVIAFLGVLLLLGSYALHRDGLAKYQGLGSVVTLDRYLKPISIKENAKGLYVFETESIPVAFKKLLVQKEDAYFYYHPGINPISMVRALTHYFFTGRIGGSSTLTQQLAKNLLGTESNRTIYNKVKETAYAISLEIFLSKESILSMYANTVFLGNQVQGFETGSYAYFDKPLKETTTNEQLALLATLSHPSTRNPWEKDNAVYAEALHKELAPDTTFIPAKVTTAYAFQTKSAFELDSAAITCTSTCTTTIDLKLNEFIRNAIQKYTETESARGARNGAVVVIDPKNSELLALVGSPDPTSTKDGNRINMALAPRPIGSTVKPLLYLKGFMEGLRPFTLVEDREYKYPIATGFSLYPKNYDGKYRGTITLHEALSNSLNVPSVKVLEYIGLEKFYGYLSESLHFKPIQDYDSYQYGIALGGLEMDLLSLTHYFTIFPRYGTRAQLKTILTAADQPTLPPQSHIDTTEIVADPKYVELVNAILSDRFTGVEQFGLASNLNLTTKEYGVKTGTSRDFHDSWVVGYTPDFVVGVWIGNTENEALEQVSGQSGAGVVWHEVMEYLLASPYHTDTTFITKDIVSVPIGNSNQWGLAGDKIATIQSLLQKNNLILSVHDGDTFEFTNDTTIPLRARNRVSWTANGKPLGEGEEVFFKPTAAGNYEITATDPLLGNREILLIKVVSRD